MKRRNGSVRYSKNSLSVPTPPSFGTQYRVVIAPEPDILCEISGEGPVAFELKEICDETLAEFLNYLKKGDNPEGKVLRLISSDDLREFLEHVRGKNYTSSYRIELLFYTGGRYSLPLDITIPIIKSVFTAESHCFKRVWFMSEPDETCECVVEA